MVFDVRLVVTLAGGILTRREQEGGWWCSICAVGATYMVSLLCENSLGGIFMIYTHFCIDAILQ